MTQKQNFLKKTAIATMALSLVAGSATGIMASAKSKQGHDDHKSKFKINLQFKDVSEKEMKWAYNHIIRLAAQGVFNGYEDGDFKPQNKVSRIEAIVGAVRLLGLQAEAEKPENMNAKLNFKDFNEFKKKNAWAVGYLTVALENDLFAETETSIQANKPADRLWASILLVKAMKLDAEAKAKMDTELEFRDAREIPAGAVGYVAVALEKNLITGYNDKTFQPHRPVTRAELAAILDRVDQQLPEQSAQAITGVVQTSANGVLTVKKADNTTVTVTAASNVFVFRNDVKVALTAIQPGDEVLVRTFEGKAVFIEVTKIAPAVINFTETGKVSTFAVNGEGKITTITITKEVTGGTAQSIVLQVDPNVTISPAGGVLAPNATVTVTGTNNVVKTITITAAQ
ncbi:S-layer protein [Cohnella kolymensis]|uniref:S-layer protein n=1 Tax=Cohnella kolymensis TaxID=1590652 RepID=A0ABR5A567_9BACL|nr:S-layer homology domain-containing protein [Cohnella kolymensis]KIL36179.1 S-layer protein [Cohnella kolymensis]